MICSSDRLRPSVVARNRLDGAGVACLTSAFHLWAGLHPERVGLRTGDKHVQLLSKTRFCLQNTPTGLATIVLHAACQDELRQVVSDGTNLPYKMPSWGFSFWHRPDRSTNNSMKAHFP